MQTLVHVTGASAMSGPMQDDANRRTGVPPTLGLGAELEADLQCAFTNTLPVLITAPGDVAGTLASRIHRNGLNRKAPFMTIDCARTHLPEQLEAAFESVGPKGTVFLRDVDRLSPTLQAHLHFRIVPRGVRVIAATSISLLRAATLGAFSERLFYRLNQIHLVASHAAGYPGAA
jgi:DNA-binding NtrC family response regulator